MDDRRPSPHGAGGTESGLKADSLAQFLPQLAPMKLYAAPLDFRAIADEFDVPTDFPPELHSEAANAQDRYADRRRDAREIEFVTICLLYTSDAADE